jgi:phosphate starvation-inducible protein PhoH
VDHRRRNAECNTSTGQDADDTHWTNSKIVITGDVEQADRAQDSNGLYDLCAKLAQTPVAGIAVCEMQTRDVQRHSIIGSVLKLYAA